MAFEERVDVTQAVMGTRNVSIEFCREVLETPVCTNIQVDREVDGMRPGTGWNITSKHQIM